VELPALLRETGRCSQGLVTHGDLLRAGASRAALSRAVSTAAVVRVRRQVYALEALPALPRYVVSEAGVSAAYAVHVRAVLLSLGSGAAGCRRTAAACYGWGLLVEPGRTVEVATDHGRGHWPCPACRPGSADRQPSCCTPSWRGLSRCS
jgi:hypothetical protein